tara:strand:- start:1870 stop:2469 length:600 start_codon:yes stop_codon:yes gene_type:complete
MGVFGLPDSKLRREIMELYKVYTKNNKLKLEYPRNIAFGLMEQMKVGDKFYFNVSELTARRWCIIFERKQWRCYNEFYDDKVRRRHRVKFKVIKNGALKCIEKLEDREVYTNKKHSFEFRKDMVISIDDVNFSIRTAHVLKDSKFKYLEELVDMPDSSLLRCKNLGNKSLKEIKEKLNEYELLKGFSDSQTRIKENIWV